MPIRTPAEYAGSVELLLLRSYALKNHFSGVIKSTISQHCYNVPRNFDRTYGCGACTARWEEEPLIAEGAKRAEPGMLHIKLNLRIGFLIVLKVFSHTTLVSTRSCTLVRFTSSNSFISTIVVIIKRSEKQTPLESIQRGIVNSFVCHSRVLLTQSCVIVIKWFVQNNCLDRGEAAKLVRRLNWRTIFSKKL